MIGASLSRHALLGALGLSLAMLGRIAQEAMVTRLAAPGESARVTLERVLPPMRGERLHVAIVEVTYAPGAGSAAHVHRCPVVGHVVAGALRTRSDGGAEHVYRAGESFQEDAGQAHLVSANASDSLPVTFLAYFVCNGDGPRSVALTREIPR